MTMDFINYVKEAEIAGCVSFWALSYAIIKNGTAFEDVSVIGHLVLLGEVNARLVEDYLANRSEEDRERARKVLLTAETWTVNPVVFENAVVSVAHRHVSTVPPFTQFCTAMDDLMLNLRKGMPRSNIIAIPWAKAAIRVGFFFQIIITLVLDSYGKVL